MSTKPILEPKDFSKINRTRRNRGYSFEHGIVTYLQKIGWHAKRLGGSSTNLPDILAVYKDTMYSMEAKYTMDKNHLYIPFDQVFRCLEVLTMFPLYPERFLVFAFRFGKGKTPIDHYFGFDIRETNMIKQFSMFPEYLVRCDREGHLLIGFKNSWIPLTFSNRSQKLPLALNDLGRWVKP